MALWKTKLQLTTQLKY